MSHKILIENDMAAQHSEIMAKLERGQIIEGVVKNITNFGAFWILEAWMAYYISLILAGAGWRILQMFLPWIKS